jgi:hypothetical protein
MSRRFQSTVPDRLREAHEVDVPGVWNVYLAAVGVVALVGLVSGVVWIAWRIASARFAQ